MAELEAESVAHAVFGRRYPRVELPDHLAQHFAEVPELRGLDLERDLTAAGRILETADGFRSRRVRSKKASRNGIHPYQQPHRYREHPAPPSTAQSRFFAGPQEQ